MHYHIAVRGVQSGPFSVDELRRKLATGELSGSDFCWQEGWAQWRPVAQVLALSDTPPAFPPRSPATAAATTSGMAITSLVLGIAGFLICFAALPAIICGHVARSKIKAANGALTGAGMALAGLILGYVTMGISVVILPAMIIPAVAEVRASARQTVDAANLREIVTASLIYAADHRDNLPAAGDGWNYAAEIARGGGLNDAQMWFAGADKVNTVNLTTVLAGTGRDVSPEFRSARLSYAMPLGGISVNMPSTTPIAWTRGLRADGTWSADAPYGTRGGHIAFLGGEVIFVRRLAPDTLVRFGGGGNTLNIREALPPGVRVFEP